MARAALALAAVLALVLAASALGGGISQSKGLRPAPQWKVLSLGSSGNNFTFKPGQAFADGIGFAFGTTEPALFLTSQRGTGLLGDLTGKTLTATFTINGTATAFTYNQPDPDHCGLAVPASVSLYFEGNTKGPNTNARQWWSYLQSHTLTSLVGSTLTLTVPLGTANWSGKGVLASDVPADLPPRSRR